MKGKNGPSEGPSPGKASRRCVFTPEERAFRRLVGLEIEGETKEAQRERLAALLDEVYDECDDVAHLPLGEEDRRALEQANIEFAKLLNDASTPSFDE